MPPKQHPRKRKSAPRKPEPLSDGDALEFSLSQELPYPKGASTWVKAGVHTTVRPGESSEEAKERAVEWVTDFLDERIRDIMAD